MPARLLSCASSSLRLLSCASSPLAYARTNTRAGLGQNAKADDRMQVPTPSVPHFQSTCIIIVLTDGASPMPPPPPPPPLPLAPFASFSSPSSSSLLSSLCLVHVHMHAHTGGGEAGGVGADVWAGWRGNGRQRRDGACASAQRDGAWASAQNRQLRCPQTIVGCQRAHGALTPLTRARTFGRGARRKQPPDLLASQDTFSALRPPASMRTPMHAETAAGKEVRGRKRGLRVNGRGVGGRATRRLGGRGDRQRYYILRPGIRGREGRIQGVPSVPLCPPCAHSPPAGQPHSGRARNAHAHRGTLLTHKVEHPRALRVACSDGGLLEERVQPQLLLPAWPARRH